MKRLVALGGSGLVLLGVSAAVVLASREKPAGAAVVLTSREKSAGAAKCAPSVARSNRRIAPGLRMVRVSRKGGTCRSWIAVIGGKRRDLWGFNYSGGLWHSSDELRTWRLVWKGPAHSFVERAFRTASGHVLIEVGFAGDRRPRQIMRSTTKAARKFKTAFVLPPGSSLHFATSWGQYSAVGAKPRTIYVGEYGHHPNPVHLWTSTNDGRSFRAVFSLPGRRSGSPDRVRHVHGVFLDPVTKWLWVAIGDNTPEPRVGYSKDGGRTFTWITKSVYPQSRVYWGSDVPELPGALYRWDRSTGEITRIITDVSEPFFDARQSHGWFVQFSEISTKEDDGYIGDEHVHVLIGNGSRWYHVTTPWTRNPAFKFGKVAPLGMTWPDPAGCFWLSLPNLVGATSGLENIKVCLGR
jgi:hypothetical protein